MNEEFKLDRLQTVFKGPMRLPDNTFAVSFYDLLGFRPVAPQCTLSPGDRIFSFEATSNHLNPIKRRLYAHLAAKCLTCQVSNKCPSYAGEFYSVAQLFNPFSKEV